MHKQFETLQNKELESNCEALETEVVIKEELILE
jgi:hypothetical protein